MSDIRIDELDKAMQKLALGKAAGMDGIPAELWKALRHKEHLMTSILYFCNVCWHQHEVPKEWHKSIVTVLFKKGDISDCENYRPISLQCVIYKIFA